MLQQLPDRALPNGSIRERTSLGRTPPPANTTWYRMSCPAKLSPKGRPVTKIHDGGVLGTKFVEFVAITDTHCSAQSWTRKIGQSTPPAGLALCAEPSTSPCSRNLENAQPKEECYRNTFLQPYHTTGSHDGPQDSPRCRRAPACRFRANPTAVTDTSSNNRHDFIREGASRREPPPSPGAAHCI